jgi:hypothetical protein
VFVRFVLLVLRILWTIEFVVVIGIVVDRILQFPRNVIVGFVEEPDQAIDLVAGASLRSLPIA